MYFAIITFFRFYFLSMYYGCIPVYVFLLLCLYILIVCLCIFIVPAGTLRPTCLRGFRAFSSVVRQMPGYNKDGACPALFQKWLFCSMYFFLCHSVYCLCVNVYCTAATGCHPNCSLTNKAVSIHLMKQTENPCSCVSAVN
jgi:hypothetical protein